MGTVGFTPILVFILVQTEQFKALFLTARSNINGHVIDGRWQGTFSSWNTAYCKLHIRKQPQRILNVLQKVMSIRFCAWCQI